MAATGALSFTSNGGLSSSWPAIRFSAASRTINANSRACFGSLPEFQAASFQLLSGAGGGRYGYERTKLLAGDYDARRKGGAGRLKDYFRTLVPSAAVKEEHQQQQLPEQVAVQTSSTLKEFLEDLKTVGRVRLIVNTGVAVLESVTSFEKLSYHVSARGEYANIMSRDDNVDFHLLVEKVAMARLVTGLVRGKSNGGGIPTCMVRFVDVNDSVAISVLVMWKLGTDGEYDPGQVEAFEGLVEKYGEEVKFAS